MLDIYIHLYCVDPDGQQLPLAIIQYSFLHGKRLPVKIKSHGNAKGSTHPYMHTAHSILADIKENVKKMAPKEEVRMVYEKAGGVVSANSLSELPRDRRQAYNVKRYSECTSGIASNQHKDLIYDLLEQHFGSLKQFVRNVSFDDAVSCVLFTNQQLYDVERFCTNKGSITNSVFGVDPMFNLGDFYVTVTTYENLLLVNRKTRKYPVFIDPMLVHQKRTFENYFYFALKLLKHQKSLATLCAVGTNGEEPLSNALCTVFPEAIKLLCSFHKWENIKMKLREFGAPEKVKRNNKFNFFY